MTHVRRSGLKIAHQVEYDKAISSLKIFISAYFSINYANFDSLA